MSNSDYNKIISTINSVTQDYTYTPDPNNLICIDTSNNRIGINTIDPSCALHISGGDIQVNNIYSNIISAQNYGVVNATTVNATTVNATTNIDVSKISVSNLLDISVGLIHANTIYGSVAKINANANASSDIITIDISNSTGVNINTAADSCGNALTINGVRVATTQHITNAVPYGVIVAYYSSTNIPNGWALCNGSNNTPDLRGRFILGLNPPNPSYIGGTIIMDDPTYIYHKFLTVGPDIFTPVFDTTIDILVVGGGGGGNTNASGGRGGSVLRLNNYVVSETSTYNIVVGYGGQPNAPGGNSSAFGFIASGGIASTGSGQDGTEDNILGTNYYWGGSGASGNTNGGRGGGGAGYAGVGGGGYNNGGNNVGSGGANTGGGGGGFSLGTPGSGGSGIVVIRYLRRARNGLSLNIVNISGGEENVSSFTTSTSTSSSTRLSTTTGLTVPTFNNMPPYYVLVYIMKIDTDFSYNTIPTLPSAPVFSIVENFVSVTLTWSEPLNTGNSPIIGYRIYNGSDLEANEDSLGSSIRTYTVVLTVGATYNFTLTAINSVGESKSMPGQTRVIAGTLIPPDVPRSLSYTQTSNTITITWLAPNNFGNQEFLGYIVNVDGIDKPLTTFRTYTESNILLNTPYIFKVKSKSGDLTSDYTSIVSVTITVTVTPAGAPRNLTALRTANTTIRLSWNIPTSLGNPNFTKYFINMNSIDIAYVTANTLTFTKSDLAFGTNYSFRVRAAYNGIYSQYSNEQQGLLRNEPDPPSFTVQLISGSPDSVVINYEIDGFSGDSPIKNYIIYESDNELYNTGSLITGTYVYSGLSIGSTYVFGVAAENQNGYVSNYTIQSITLNSLVAPSEPRWDIYTQAGQSEGPSVVILRWLAPEFEGSSEIESYTIYIDTIPYITMIPATDRTYQTFNLGFGVHYFRIEAINYDGLSTSSAIVSLNVIAMN